VRAAPRAPRPAPRVAAIAPLAHSTGIVKHGKQLDYVRVGSFQRREPSSVFEDAGPVRETVDPLGGQDVSFDDPVQQTGSENAHISHARTNVFRRREPNRTTHPLW